jgi:hypothetical protein
VLLIKFFKLLTDAFKPSSSRILSLMKSIGKYTPEANDLVSKGIRVKLLASVNLYSTLPVCASWIICTEPGASTLPGKNASLSYPVAVAASNLALTVASLMYATLTC